MAPEPRSNMKCNSFFSRRGSLRFVLTLFAASSLVAAMLPQSFADKPTTKALVTDRVNLPLSNLFGTPDQLALTNTGDVFFTTGTTTALFRRDASSGTRTRLLQAGNPHPGFPSSTMEDLVAFNPRVNAAGHVAMANFFVQEAVRPSRGIFIYNGTSFQKVVLSGEVAPGTGGQLFDGQIGQFRINDFDQVAFRARFEPIVLGGFGVFIGSPTGPPAKIAVQGETAPGTGGGTYASLQLIGLNNAGQVAFLANIAGGTTPRGVFMGTPAGVNKVVAAGDPAPSTAGTFRLPGNPARYALNGSGDVAFNAGVAGGGAINSGIWIGNISGPPTKLVVNTDPTGTALGGTIDGGISLRGFNNAGKVLFQSNPAGATNDHALFLKDLSNPAQVVFARNQAVPGAPTQTFGFTQRASLNNNGDVAFLASLQAGVFPFGWFLGSGTAVPVKIAFEGDPTPVGGTFGLAGRNLDARLNASGQVAFFADILGPNGVGAFLFTPGSGIASIVNTNDALPAGANPIISAGLPGASDDQLVFYALKAGGRVTILTKPLKPGGGQITRLIGEGDTAPGIGGALWNIDRFVGMINNDEEVAFNSNSIIGGLAYPASGIFTHKPGVGAQKVVATGDFAPGGGTFGGVFIAEARPKINSLGQVAIFAEISTGDIGIFIGSVAGGVQKVSRTSDPSPTGGTIVDFPTDVSMNDTGRVAFGATVENPVSVFKTVLFVGSGTAAPMKVVAEGDPVPGGTVSAIPVFFQMNNAGQVAYAAALTGGPSSKGLFLGTAGGAQSVVALIGDTAPGTGGGTFSDFRDLEVKVNNSGQVVFWGSVAGSSATTGYFLGSATAAPVARLIEGQALPGGGAAAVLSPVDSITLTDSGEMNIFVLNITGAANNFRHVIADPTGVLAALATNGEKAKGTGSVFGEIVQPVANSAGQFFFSSVMVGGPTKWGIFTNK